MTDNELKSMITANIPISATLSNNDRIAMDNSIKNMVMRVKDEEILFAFWCSSVYNGGSIVCNYTVCCITDKRIIYMSDPGRGLLSSTISKIEKSISLKDINDVTMHTQPSFAMFEGSMIEVDTIKEDIKFKFFRSKPDYATQMFPKLYDAIETAKKKNNRRIAEENAVVVNNNFSVADELLKLKSLLDMGVLSAEEFEKKKKELLAK